jgi:hypothetical protein
MEPKILELSRYIKYSMIPIRKKISNVSNIGDGTVDNDEFNKLDNVSGDLIGTTGTQTLTNKDISSVTNALPSTITQSLVQAQFGAIITVDGRYLRRSEIAAGTEIDSVGTPDHGRPDAAWVIPYDCTLVRVGWQQDHTSNEHTIRIYKTVGTEIASFLTGAYHGTESLNIPLLQDDWIYVQLSSLSLPVSVMVTIYALVDTPTP